MALGLVVTAGMPLNVQAASIDAGGTVITDPEVPLADTDLGAGDESVDPAAVDDEEVGLTTVNDEDVPLSSMIMGKGCSFAFHLLLLVGGAVVGAVGMKTVDTVGKKDEKADGQK